MLKEDFLDLTEATTQNLEDVAVTPASGLGSTRDKPDVEYCLKMFKVMQAHDIRYFFYIGGNDSSDTCRIVNEQAKATGYDLVCVHVPKTIDNDLAGGTDHCPGFGSAAKFVGQAFAGANLDNRALPGVYIDVVMGRHAGFLTAASALGRKFEDDGPHLIYMPERVFDADKFVADVQKVYDKYGRCIIAVSEGVSDKSGAPIITSLKGSEKDSHGNVQLSGTGALGDLLADLIKAKTKIKRVRADTLGYLQRSFLGCISPERRRRGARGRPAGRAVRRHPRQGRLGGHQAGGRLRRHLRPDPARGRGGQDPPHGRRLHQRRGQQRHRGVPQVLPPARGRDADPGPLLRPRPSPRS